MRLFRRVRLVSLACAALVVVFVVVAVWLFRSPARVASLSFPRGRTGPLLQGEGLLHVVGASYFPHGTYECGEGLRVTVGHHTQALEVDAVLFQDACETLQTLAAENIHNKVRARDVWVVESLEKPQCRQHAKYAPLFDIMSTYRLDCGAYQRSYAWWFAELNVMQKMREPLTRDAWDAKSREFPVFWAASNCGSQSGREFAIKRLSSYIGVARYGSCMQNMFDHPFGYAYERSGAGLKSEDALNAIPTEWARKHMFYLAMENGNCDDYVTEKFWKALFAGVIPIVDGPNDYSAFLPHPKAVIRFDAFATRKELAAYLYYLTTNYTAYMEHMPWKTDPNFEYPESFQRLVRPGKETLRDGERLCQIMRQANEIRSSPDGTCASCCRLPDLSCYDPAKWGKIWYADARFYLGVLGLISVSFFATRFVLRWAEYEGC